jgi:hypothetical protein
MSLLVCYGKSISHRKLSFAKGQKGYPGPSCANYSPGPILPPTHLFGISFLFVIFFYSTDFKNRIQYDNSVLAVWNYEYHIYTRFFNPLNSESLFSGIYKKYIYSINLFSGPILLNLLYEYYVRKNNFIASVLKIMWTFSLCLLIWCENQK